MSSVYQGTSSVTVDQSVLSARRQSMDALSVIILALNVKDARKVSLLSMESVRGITVWIMSISHQ